MTNVNFKSIIQNAIEINCDCDSDGNIDGAIFAAEQIIQDLDKHGYQVLTKIGKPASSGLSRIKPVKRKK
jgi:hypothetical protein